MLLRHGQGNGPGHGGTAEEVSPGQKNLIQHESRLAQNVIRLKLCYVRKLEFIPFKGLSFRIGKQGIRFPFLRSKKGNS